MRICGLEKFSLVDFDGILACSIFTAGCNFACPFCHNSALVLDASEQIEISSEEVFEFLEKRKHILGGVCVSGGEPTLQPDLADFLAKVKLLGYKIKLDTNGSNPFVLKRLIDAQLIDYVAMDIKNSLENYDITVGKENFSTENVEKSVKLLMNGKLAYEFRTTLVDELHSEEDIKNIGVWLSGANKYFLQKFVDKDSCIVDGLNAVTEEKAKKFKSILSQTISSVNLRGY